jgi:glycosyltransferase involved in cell wall biosynthesis
MDFGGREWNIWHKEYLIFGYQDPLPYQLESSISCMTSLYEGWGMVLTEAMQCGAVPIAFNSFASVTDVIDHGRNGILVKPFSIKQYEKELRGLMDNLDLLKRLSENAMQDIKKYNVDCVVDQWEELFQEFNNG